MAIGLVCSGRTYVATSCDDKVIDCKKSIQKNCHAKPHCSVFKNKIPKYCTMQGIGILTNTALLCKSAQCKDLGHWTCSSNKLMNYRHYTYYIPTT